MFDASFDVLHVFLAECLPNVLALDSVPVDPREIGIGEIGVVVPDAVIVNAGEAEAFQSGRFC